MIYLSIIILNFNTAELTNACIKSLFTYYGKQIENGEFEVIIVDNASKDTSVEKIKAQEWFSKIQLIENKENYGFSKGCNIGAHQARGRDLLFLNSDTRMMDNGLRNMVEYLGEQEKIGILGGRLQNANGSYQASAGFFYTLPRVLFLLLGAERFGKLRYSPEKKEKVDWVSGAMLMIKKDLFRKLGGFDEKIFMYMEDMELCFRVQKEGKAVFFYPDCTIQHLSQGSSNRSFAIIHIYKGLLYFFKKHTNLLEYSIVKLLLVGKAIVLIVLGVCFRRNSLRETYTKALHVAL